MRQLFVILIAVSMVIMPLHSFGLGQECCCVGLEDTSAIDQDQNANASDACCVLIQQSTDAEQSEDPQPQSPCDENDCPMSCCQGALQQVVAVAQSVRVIPSISTIQLVDRYEDSDRSPPHLLQLKRPPKLI